MFKTAYSIKEKSQKKKDWNVHNGTLDLIKPVKKSQSYKNWFKMYVGLYNTTLAAMKIQWQLLATKTRLFHQVYLTNVPLLNARFYKYFPSFWKNEEIEEKEGQVV